MATTFELILAPEDERALFTFLAPMELDVWPETIPRDWKTFPANADAVSRFDALPDTGMYLAAPRFAPLVTRTVKRGKDKGTIELDETQSPVIHFERTLPDEDGVWIAGHLWTQVDLSGDARFHPAFPDAFRKLIVALREYVAKNSHRSKPGGYFVGMHAARAHKAGRRFREPGHRGRAIIPHR